MKAKILLLAVLVLGYSALYVTVKAYLASESQRKVEQVQFQASLARAKETLEQTTASVKAQQEALARSRAQISKLERTLRRHDLAFLAKAKPCLIARRMTAGTREAYQKIASSTGAAIEQLTGPEPKVCKPTS